MPIKFTSAEDFFDIYDDYPITDWRYSRRSISFLDEFYFDDSAIAFGSIRATILEEFGIDEVLEGHNTKIPIFVSEDVLFYDDGIVSGYGKLKIVNDNFRFAESIDNHRRIIIVNDNFNFAETKQFRFSKVTIAVIDNYVVAEQVFKTLVLDKNNLKVSDSFGFNESNVKLLLPRVVSDNLIFTEIIDRWLPRQRPSINNSLIFVETIFPLKGKPPNTDNFSFGESICVCLVLKKILNDSFLFSEQTNVYIANRVVPPPDGGLGTGDGVDFTLTLDIDIFEKLLFYEGFVVLKNNINIAERACCA